MLLDEQWRLQKVPTHAYRKTQHSATTLTPMQNLTVNTYVGVHGSSLIFTSLLEVTEYIKVTFACGKCVRLSILIHRSSPHTHAPLLMRGILYYSALFN